MVLRFAATLLVRTVAVTIVVALATPLVAASAGSDPKLPLGEACDIFSERALQKAFDAPVKLVLFDPLGLYDCVFKIGDGTDVPGGGGGQFHFIQVFPGLPLHLPTAREVLEDQRAVDVLANAEIVDVENLGRLAYVNYTDGSLVVVASKKYAFKLTYKDADPDAGLTKADEKVLKVLARKLIKRAPK